MILAGIIEFEIYLVRHGQSKGNVRSSEDATNLSLFESEDPVLTETGIIQAQKVGEFLKNIPFTTIFSSGLLRAVHTATEIIEKQGETTPLEILPLLTEAGVCDEYSTSLDVIREINPSAIVAKDFEEIEGLICHTSSKDEKALFERAEKAIKYFKNRYSQGEKIAVVSHGAFITYLVFHLMGFTSCPIFDLDFNNTGVTKVTVYKKGTNPYGDVIFSYINSTSHLDK